MTGLTLHTNPRQPVRWSGLPLRGPGLALSLLAVVLVGGTMGYVVIENWSVWDALYMTVTTVATVGYLRYTRSRGGTGVHARPGDRRSRDRPVCIQ